MLVFFAKHLSGMANTIRRSKKLKKLVPIFLFDTGGGNP
jgi:hypothetical protein